MSAFLLLFRMIAASPVPCTEWVDPNACFLRAEADRQLLINTGIPPCRFLRCADGKVWVIQ